MEIKSKFLKKVADEFMGVDPMAPVDMGMQATDGTMPMEAPPMEPPMMEQPPMGMEATDGTMPPQPPNLDMQQATDGIVPQASMKNRVVVLSNLIDNRIMHQLAENDSEEFTKEWNEHVLSKQKFSFKKKADMDFSISDINNAPFAGESAQNDPRYNGQMEQDQMSALNTPSNVTPENDPRYNGGLEANNGMPNEYFASKNNKIISRLKK